MKARPGLRPVFAPLPPIAAGSGGAVGGAGVMVGRFPVGRGELTAIGYDGSTLRPSWAAGTTGWIHRGGRGRGDMAEYGESGGVRALRAWADEAAERAARLVGQGGEGSPVSAEEFESSIAELSRLRPLLDHDPELLGRVTLVLGGLLATRHATGRGTPGDPERARRLLEEVRDRTTAAGERMAEDGRRWAATFLMMVSGHTEPGRPAGSPRTSGPSSTGRWRPGPKGPPKRRPGWRRWPPRSGSCRCRRNSRPGWGRCGRCWRTCRRPTSPIPRRCWPCCPRPAVRRSAADHAGPRGNPA